MEPINLNELFLTCKTIVNTEIKDHCNIILERINSLVSLSEKKGQRKTLKKLKKKVKKVRKFSNK
jgi:hypothetical protein